MPRPPKIGSNGQRLTQRLAFRLSPDEEAELVAKANKAGLWVSEYLRECIVGNRTELSGGLSWVPCCVIKGHRK